MTIRIKTAFGLAALVLASGCASIAVTDDALVERTAFALGIDRGSFTISNRVDDGTTTRYQVATRDGRRFNCFVGGSINVLGRVVTEAICNRPGEAPKNPLTGR